MVVESPNEIQNEPGKKEDYETKYSLSEIFTAPQGEGAFVGKLHTFIRFAGCSVGRPYRDASRYSLSLPQYLECCTTVDGRQFTCDTDFRKKIVLSVDEIMHEIRSDIRDVCLTGGEPLDRDLDPLITRLQLVDKMVHIETSGTKIGSKKVMDPEMSFFIYVAVSPKLGVRSEMISRADEIKFLVDEKFTDECIEGILSQIKETNEYCEIFLQPVNFEKEINQSNVDRCLEIQNRYPEFRISIQSHKIWKSR